MPVMNGVEAASGIGKSLPGVPVLLYTSYAFPATKAQAKEVGVRRIVQKPDVAGLVKVLEDLLGRTTKRAGVKETDPMTIQDALHAAIAGAGTFKRAEVGGILTARVAVTDRLFWESLGKTLGWITLNTVSLNGGWPNRVASDVDKSHRLPGARKHAGANTKVSLQSPCGERQKCPCVLIQPQQLRLKKGPRCRSRENARISRGVQCVPTRLIVRP